MNEWDQRGEAIAEPLTRGERQTLLSDDRVTLATWLTQLAMILERRADSKTLGLAMSRPTIDLPVPRDAWLSRRLRDRLLAYWAISSRI